VTWGIVLSLAAGTYLIRITGLLLRGRITVSARVERLVDLGATALLVALVAVNAVGVAVGALAAWRKAPFVLVVVLAAATTALLRLAGIH